MEQHERTLCKLSLGDDAFIEAALAGDGANKAASELDANLIVIRRVFVAVNGVANFIQIVAKRSFFFSNRREPGDRQRRGR